MDQTTIITKLQAFAAYLDDIQLPVKQVDASVRIAACRNSLLELAAEIKEDDGREAEHQTPALPGTEI